MATLPQRSISTRSGVEIWSYAINRIRQICIASPHCALKHVIRDRCEGPFWRRLKKLLAESMLDVSALKDLLGKN